MQWKNTIIELFQEKREKTNWTSDDSSDFRSCFESFIKKKYAGLYKDNAIVHYVLMIMMFEFRV